MYCGCLWLTPSTPPAVETAIMYCGKWPELGKDRLPSENEFSPLFTSALVCSFPRGDSSVHRPKAGIALDIQKADWATAVLLHSIPCPPLHCTRSNNTPANIPPRILFPFSLPSSHRGKGAREDFSCSKGETVARAGRRDEEGQAPFGLGVEARGGK